MKDENSKEVTVNKETIDILVANVIPTTKYFESRFDFMQHQINELKDGQKDLKKYVDIKFNEVDKRFEQVDKRFEQVDNDLKDVKKSINELSKEVHNLALSIKESDRNRDVKFRDLIIERDRYYDKKFNNLRMFNIALISLVGGIILKITGFLDKVLK